MRDLILIAVVFVAGAVFGALVPQRVLPHLEAALAALDRAAAEP